MRLRRHVAFDRFLSRVFAAQPDDLIVKGVYALECNLVVELRQAVDEVRGFCNKYNLIL